MREWVGKGQKGRYWLDGVFCAKQTYVGDEKGACCVLELTLIWQKIYNIGPLKKMCPLLSLSLTRESTVHPRDDDDALNHAPIPH